MTEIATILILNAFYIGGFYTICDYELDRSGNPTSKMLLWWVKHYGEIINGKQIMKPITSCLICMSSFHGYAFYFGWVFICKGFEWFDLFIFPVYLVILVGLMRAYDRLFN